MISSAQSLTVAAVCEVTTNENYHINEVLNICHRDDQPCVKSL